MFEVTKDMIIGDVVMNAPETVPYFQSIGMHCIGCAMSSGESVEEACMVHDVDPDQFIELINKAIAAGDANPSSAN